MQIHSANPKSNGEAVRTWQLRHSRRSKLIVEVVPDISGLYRIHWPDTGPSPTANLTRCKDAALEWAEGLVWRTEHRKNGAGRALKSLNDFSWSPSLARKSEPALAKSRPRHSGAMLEATR